MNLLSRIFGINDSHLDAELVDSRTPEEIAEAEANAKKARIDHHRRNVRTGPVSFRKSTSPARAEKLVRKSAMKKAARRQRNRWIDVEHECARLRGRLEVLGLLDTPAGKATANHELAANALGSLIAEFGGDNFDIEREGAVKEVLEAAGDRYGQLLRAVA